MYKKLFAILIIATFLIVSVGVISAAEDSIPVKIVWDGNSNDRPSSVTVNLIEDGVVVDSAQLSSGNGWKTTFKVDDDGHYQVTVESGSDYLSRVYGNAKSGFVIKSHVIKSDVLSNDDDSSSDKSTSSDSDSSKTDAPASDKRLSDSDNSVSDIGTHINGSSPLTADDSNGTKDDNSTSDDTNGTDDANSTDDSTDNSTDDSKSSDDSKDKSTKKDSKTTTKTTKTTETTKIASSTKIIKQDKKKPENTTKSKMNHTGFPILVLIIAVFAAIFIPLNRKR